MPEGRDLPLRRWGEELRRQRRASRANRLNVAGTALAAAVTTALAGTLFWPARPLLVWNASASSPRGLYAVAAAEVVRPGDLVVAWPPPAAREFGDERRYLPFGVPLVKRVAAAGGERVCASGRTIFIDGRIAAVRLASDPLGRPMPWWSGCETLAAGDLFLLSAHLPRAFDGRYFGVTRRQEVIGQARLLWRR
jgi:conjugative transfer signal peptidase TraF